MSQRTRDTVGTAIVFVILLVLTFGIILLEFYLENFKAH